MERQMHLRAIAMQVFKVQFLARKGDTRTISVPDNEYILESAGELPWV